MKNFILLQIVPSLDSGGVEQGTIDLAKGLIKNGYESFVVSNGGEMLRILERYKITHFKLPVHSKNLITMYLNIWRLKNIINKNNINIIHVRSRAPAWSAFFCKSKKTKLISTFHNIYGHQNIIKKKYNESLAKSDKIIAISEYVKKSIIKIYNIEPKKITVIHRGIDLNFFDLYNLKDEVQTLTEVFHKMESVIRERTELLEASNRQLDEASRAKGMYLISMSHELRTPLNAIIGFAEVLLESGKEGPLSVYQIDRLSRILKSGQHLLVLINSLLDLSKIEAGQMEVSKSDFQLKILLQDVMEWLEPLMQKKSLEYELVFHPDTSIMLYSDSGKVRQVLINLLGNAIKFTDSGGRIEVSSSQDKTGISIAVQDTGCGISAEQQQSIFDVFHQVNSSGIRVDSSDLTLQKGTGLGLALVQSLMKLLGGSVSLESVYGKGSTFTIHFQ